MCIIDKTIIKCVAITAVIQIIALAICVYTGLLELSDVHTTITEAVIIDIVFVYLNETNFWSKSRKLITGIFEKT